MGLVFYVLLLAALALNAPGGVLDPGSGVFFVLLGTLGLWRYGWGLVHVVRSAIYRGIVFPGVRRELRRREEFMERTAPVPRSELFLVVTTFRIATEISLEVYRAAVAEAVRWRGRATIVASIVEPADERLIKAIFTAADPPEHVRLVIVRLPGKGKRRALGVALRAVSRARPHPDAAVAVMDGDTVLTPGCLGRSVPFLRMLPTVGAFTTDERPRLFGRGRLFDAWFQLRFAQRHQIMSSLALSRRLLAVTGRFSVFRASIATHPDFIDRIENDGLDHWRLGHVSFLTGEDKSTWNWLLERGWEMLYVPDVDVVTLEQPPRGGFVASTTALQLRWAGNMLRSGANALALGPTRIGWFLWWCLVDQRVSVWTPLIAPVLAILFTIARGPEYLYAYLLWVMSTRLVQTLVLLTVRRTVSGFWPMLLWWNQVWGALVKGWALFRLDRQRWTRQNIAAERELMPEDARWIGFSSAWLHGLALLTLVVAVGFWAGFLGPHGADPPPFVFRG